MPGNYANFSLLGMQEWYTYPEYLNEVGCAEPESYQPPYSTMYYGNSSYSYLAAYSYNNLMLQDMECNVQVVNETIPGTSIIVETIFVQARLNSTVTTYQVNISRTIGGSHITSYPGNANTDGMTYYIRHLYVQPFFCFHILPSP